MICSSCSAALPSQATFCNVCGHRATDPFVGTTLNDRYRIEGRIALGGFGAIYRGTQLPEQRAVAIKILHPELATDANLVARFRREGAVLCRLRDAHTVTTHELGETADHRLFIVMELLEGTNLQDTLRIAGPLAWPRVFAIARAVCSALAEAHALGIVHRDLKPANIFLQTDRAQPDFVKVLDFGIAKVLHESALTDGAELTVLGQAVGTVEYMAPEQLMGGLCDGRTDIYTLGVVAFEMVTGQRPFAGVANDLLTTQLSRQPPAPSELVSVPPGVDRVLLRCLEQDAAERFPDVAALARALDDELAAVGPADHPPGAAELVARAGPTASPAEPAARASPIVHPGGRSSHPERARRDALPPPSAPGFRSTTPLPALPLRAAPSLQPRQSSWRVRRVVITLALMLVLATGALLAWC